MKRLYWSPTKHWLQREGRLWIDGQPADSVLETCFPAFYFLTQNGITKEELIERFAPPGKSKQLESAIERLRKARVLVEGLLFPEEVCAVQERLYQNPYDASLSFDKERLDKYVITQLNRCHVDDQAPAIDLQEAESLPPLIDKRRTKRRFATDRKVSFAALSQLLSAVRQRRSSASIRSYYPSAGGLYPLDLFLYVKPRRVEGIKQGFYYYDPRNHRLRLVNGMDCIIKEDHYPHNQEIFRQSAFSLFLVYQANASMPKYGGHGFYYACIEVGAVVAVLQLMAESLSLGLCPIGRLKTEPVSKCLRLTKSHVLLHSMEGGIAKDAQSGD